MLKSTIIILISLASLQLVAKTFVNAYPEGYGKPIPYEKVSGTSGTMSLQIENGKLYALENGGLSIFDISEPAAPKRLGRVGGMGLVRQLKVRGNTAFLTARHNGLWAVDVSDPSDPRIISNFDTIEMATGLDVVGNLAVVGLRVFGVQCVDVSNPAKMKHVSSIETNESQSVLYRDGLIFSGDWSEGEITIIDAKNPADLKIVNKFKLDGFGDGVAVVGKYLYASTGHNKKSGPKALRPAMGHAMEIWDISDLKNPVRLSRSQFPKVFFTYADYWTPRVCGDYVFAADTLNGLFLIDVSDKKNQKIIGNLILPKVDPENPKSFLNYPDIQNPDVPQGDPVSSAAVGDGVLYISGTKSGIFVAKMEGIAKIERDVRGVLPVVPDKIDLRKDGFVSAGEARTNPVRGAALDGDIVYAACVWDGIKAYRLSDTGFEPLGNTGVPYAFDVSIANGRLVAAEGFKGVGIYKISGVGKLEEIGRVKMKFAEFARTFDGSDVIAVYGGDAVVLFYDISNSAKPKFLLSERVNHLVYNDYGARRLAGGKYFGFPCHGKGQTIFEIGKNSAKTVFLDRAKLGSQTGGACAVDDRILFTAKGGYAFQNPAKPLKISELKIGKFPLADGAEFDSRTKAPYEGLVMYDNESKLLGVSNRIRNKFCVYDFSNPDAPKCLRAYDMPPTPNVAVFWRGRVILPCGYAGLLMEK